MCGVPFKLLDKKSEKSILFARRKKLTNLLVETTNMRDALEYTIMLLFQQCRGMAVCGTELTGLLLSHLILEKKIPQAVADKLYEAESLLLQEEVPTDLLRIIKSFGLSRDITKEYCEILDL